MEKEDKVEKAEPDQEEGLLDKKTEEEEGSEDKSTVQDTTVTTKITEPEPEEEE